MKDDPWIDAVVAGRYRIVRKLGEGGMSAVYEARHVKLQRQFAIKRLLPQLADNQEALERFEREAEMLAGLRHPNVVEVTDWDEFPDGAPCMVLEYLHGATLDRRMSRGPMPWDAIARIGDQTMSALSLAHRNGITHRDMKPENIFMAIDDVGDDRVKLLDFGVSKLRGMIKTTGMFAMLGTPSYMAPEQAQGQSDQIGAWTDVWAMGAILYEMATGRKAFEAKGIADTLMKINIGQYDPIAAYRNDASPAFVELVGRAMTEREHRIQTIDELRAGLRETLEPRNLYRLNTPVGIQTLAPPRANPTPPRTEPTGGVVVAPARHTRRWIGIVSAIAVTLVVGAIVIAFAM
ncbi:MAG: serine/threonine protein kinase [Acidobacteriota bacterium]